MVKHESLTVSQKVELPPSVREQIVTVLRENYGHYGVMQIIRFGSSLYQLKPQGDIDILVVVRSDEVVFRQAEIKLNDQLLDVKLVGKGFIDVMLQKQWDQVNPAGANMNLAPEEQWLVIALHTGVAMYGQTTGLDEQIALADQVYANLEARGPVIKQPIFQSK